MSVVLGRADLLLLQLLLYITPDLAHLEMRVHLDHLELLLLVSVQVVPCKTHPIEDREDYKSDVVLLYLLADPVDQVGLSSCLSQILQKRRFWRVFLSQLRHKWFEFVDDNSLLVFDSVLLILLTVEFDHELGGVNHGLLAVPLQKLLDCL